ncbi:LytTR family DNA-binding domain-containing protein [Rhodocytophaga aerolata]|uniref:LytTR family DNA-binding domain-containing protein n=1 Tax=Rhodocytophaga aerolata TaxID=455078 RepID=A0ABT8RFE6_9BACT|nr:LytTR family DNA-binding domain-containing protein [Rhodocytophaga aerolata]MDO1450416.1 LytTR family DNA-binding domain-containing protein [Rhodocytophaga aerolata]
MDFDRFTKAIQKALDYLDYKKTPKDIFNESLYVNSEYKLVKIVLKEIEFIESLEDYIRIHLEGTKPILTLPSMKKILEKLPSNKFKRIHRSYIVRMDKVVTILNRKAQLKVVKNYLSVILSQALFRTGKTIAINKQWSSVFC